MKIQGKKIAAATLALGLAITGSSAVAQNIVLRIGAGHPLGPTVYVDVVHDVFVPEVTRRVAEETDYTVTFVEAYGGTIAGVAETLEAVQTGAGKAFPAQLPLLRTIRSARFRAVDGNHAQGL